MTVFHCVLQTCFHAIDGARCFPRFSKTISLREEVCPSDTSRFRETCLKLKNLPPAASYKSSVKICGHLQMYYHPKTVEQNVGLRFGMVQLSSKKHQFWIGVERSEDSTKWLTSGSEVRIAWIGVKTNLGKAIASWLILIKITNGKQSTAAKCTSLYA